MRTIKIFRDEYAENPRTDYDHLGKMYIKPNRYFMGDNVNIPNDERDLIILPIYAYIHSGVTIKTTPYNDPWDSNLFGWIYVSKEDVREEWKVKRISKELKKKVVDILTAEVREYDNYLGGNVYRYEIYEDGEEIDSCGGYLMDYEELKKELQEQYPNAEIEFCD